MDRYKTRIIASALALIMSVVLAACDSADDTDATVPADSETTEPVGS